MLILSLAELAPYINHPANLPSIQLKDTLQALQKNPCTTALLLINTHLHYNIILMLTPTTNLSRTGLGESVIFQQVLQAYPTDTPGL